MRRVILFAFFMFLKKVYKYNKHLFVLMTLFIIVQLFVNYNHGIVASPFYNYGMYSEQFKIPDQYQVWEIEQNGKRLQGKDFSAQQWDKIILPISYYAAINTSNELYSREINRILSKAKISTTDKHFLQECNYQEFEKWYTAYLSGITNSTTSTLKINYRNYNFIKGRLTPTDSILPLAILCQ